MGYSLGPKTLAIALAALTHGDRAKAEKLWTAIAYEDFASWGDAWDRIEHVLEQLERDELADESEFAPGECEGHPRCTAALHVHGCYADIEGRCDSPSEHAPDGGR